MCFFLNTTYSTTSPGSTKSLRALSNRYSVTLFTCRSQQVIMPNKIHDVQTVDDTSYSYVFQQNVLVHLSNGGAIRCNIYLPKHEEADKRYPTLMTYGPYGKDIPYER